jgi:hypothetical protein
LQTATADNACHQRVEQLLQRTRKRRDAAEETLLTAIAAGLPIDDIDIPFVLADRGIGTSPTLMGLIQQFDWYLLLRVTDDPGRIAHLLDTIQSLDELFVECSR